MDAALSKDELTPVADGEVAWFWRPDAGVKLCGGIREVTGTRKPGPREEREGNRKTIVQGMPGCFGVPVVTDLVCFHFFAHKAAGAARHPAFPAPFCCRA
jgi:hypothetical protein